MRTKKVNRYYCDFCKKAGGSAGHMKRHESSCTKNPNRVCRVCGLMEVEQATMKTLLAALPKRSDFPPDEEDELGFTTLCLGFIDAINTALPSLREAASECPACIMAALRQSGMRMSAVAEFNFSNKMAGVWSDFNERQLEEETIY